MNQDDANHMWDKLVGLWPGWRQTTHTRDAWMARFAEMSERAVREAIDAHYGEHSTEFGPDLKEIVKLARSHRFDEKSAQQIAYEQRFFAMTKYEQACELREYHEKAAARAKSDWQRVKHEKIAFTAAAQARLLYDLHGTDCPPNFGPNTSKGAAPGSLFEEVKISLDSPRS